MRKFDDTIIFDVLDLHETIIVKTKTENMQKMTKSICKTFEEGELVGYWLLQDFDCPRNSELMYPNLILGYSKDKEEVKEKQLLYFQGAKECTIFSVDSLDAAKVVIEFKDSGKFASVHRKEVFDEKHKTISIIDASIELLDSTMYNRKNDESSMSEVDYIRNFKSIIIGLPRRSGKTNAINHLAKPNDIIIIPRSVFHMQKYINGNLQAFYAESFINGLVGRSKRKKEEIDTVWVDEPFITNDTFKEEFLVALNDHYKFNRIIYIGTRA